MTVHTSNRGGHAERWTAVRPSEAAGWTDRLSELHCTRGANLCTPRAVVCYASVSQSKRHPIASGGKAQLVRRVQNRGQRSHHTPRQCALPASEAGVTPREVFVRAAIRDREIASTWVAVEGHWGWATFRAGEESPQPTPTTRRGIARGAQRWNMYLGNIEIATRRSPSAGGMGCGPWCTPRQPTLITRVGRREDGPPEADWEHSLGLAGLKWRPAR